MGYLEQVHLLVWYQQPLSVAALAVVEAAPMVLVEVVAQVVVVVRLQHLVEALLAVKVMLVVQPLAFLHQIMVALVAVVLVQLAQMAQVPLGVTVALV
jgi:hypothetical protein